MKQSSGKACLIGGTGRSGTTILKQIFAKHPLVARVPEWRFTIDPDGLVDTYHTLVNGWSPFTIHVKIARLRRMLRQLGKGSLAMRGFSYLVQQFKVDRCMPLCILPRYSGLKITRFCPRFLEFAQMMLDELVEFTYRGIWNGSHLLERNRMYFGPAFEKERLAGIMGTFLRNVIDNTCQLQQAEFYVEDNTWNILHFDTLRCFLPDVKLVHIFRDPRDVVASYVTMRWAPREYLKATRWYKGIINRWFEVRESLPSDSYMEISLESLVEHPERILRSICDFWKIPWHDSLLTIDLSRSHSGRWKRDFSTAEKEFICKELHTELLALGYKCSEVNSSPKEPKPQGV